MLAGSLLITGLGVDASAAQSGDTQLATLLQCAVPIEQGAGQRLELQLTQRSPGQAASQLFATLDLQSSDASQRMRLKITAPPEVAGTSYFLRQQHEQRDMYMYLPAMERSQALKPDSRVQLPGTQLPVRYLFSLLLGGQQLSITGGREFEREGRSLRKVHVTGFDGDRPVASSLLIDRETCQVLEMQGNDGVEVSLQYSDEESRWPSRLHIRAQGQRGDSVLSVRSRQPLSDDHKLTPQKYYR